MRSAFILAATFWFSTVLALPAVFAQETCVCEPVERTYEPVSPPLSCVRTAAEISNWRALSFHRPELADQFVDMSTLGAPRASPKTSLVGSGFRGRPYIIYSQVLQQTNLNRLSKIRTLHSEPHQTYPQGNEAWQSISTNREDFCQPRGQSPAVSIAARKFPPSNPTSPLSFPFWFWGRPNQQAY
jgi:hypothetical protein